ncbi:unnamed protein product [Closterium sp. NIES-65]|nr:unnamed protein product [Closterium sp. NIES-65]
MYLARTMPPRPEVVEAFRDWDSCLEDCFEQLFPPGTWEHDPTGLGARACSCISLPRVILHSWGVAGEEAMFAEYLTTSAGAEFLDPWRGQRLLAVEELQTLRRSARDDATLARFTSLQGPGAGAWVSAVPAHSDLTFTAAEWGIAAAIRLGLPIQQLQVAGRCVCGTTYVDSADPHHALRCKHQHGPSRVYDEVKFAVAKISKASGGVVTMEDSVVLQGKRVDVAVRRPMAGEAHALEISVADPLSLSPSLLGQRSSGVALQRAQARVILLRAASSMGGINVDLVDREWDDGDAEGGALWVEAPYMVDSLL